MREREREREKRRTCRNWRMVNCWRRSETKSENWSPKRRLGFSDWFFSSYWKGLNLNLKRPSYGYYWSFFWPSCLSESIPCSFFFGEMKRVSSKLFNANAFLFLFFPVCVRFKWSGKMELLWDIYSGGPNQSHMVTGCLMDHDSWIVDCAWVGYMVKLQPE